jgi:hypothetical protein
MGVDSCDEFVRSFCFQRPITTKQFVGAVAACNQHAVHTTAYIVHKPPFLTDEEAIADTSASIRHALDMGFSAVSIEPIAIQTATLQSLLASAGLYEQPTFWSVMSSVASFAENASRLRLGGQVFTPIPERTLRVCDRCVALAFDEIGWLPSTMFRGLPRTPHGPHCGTPCLRDGQPVNAQSVVHRAKRILAALQTSALADGGLPGRQVTAPK